MNRHTFFGFDPTCKCVFVFLFENSEKQLSLFVEYLDDETLKFAQQDLSLYELFWESGTSLKSMIILTPVR